MTDTTPTGRDFDTVWEDLCRKDALASEAWKKAQEGKSAKELEAEDYAERLAGNHKDWEQRCERYEGSGIKTFYHTTSASYARSIMADMAITPHALLDDAHEGDCAVQPAFACVSFGLLDEEDLDMLGGGSGGLMILKFTIDTDAQDLRFDPAGKFSDCLVSIEPIQILSIVSAKMYQFDPEPNILEEGNEEAWDAWMERRLAGSKNL